MKRLFARTQVAPTTGAVAGGHDALSDPLAGVKPIGAGRSSKPFWKRLLPTVNRMPASLRCPLSGKRLKVAMVAADGRSYDEVALRKAMDDPHKKAMLDPRITAWLAEAPKADHLTRRRAKAFKRFGKRPHPDAVDTDPEHLICPMSGEVFRDPVVMFDGETRDLSSVYQRMLDDLGYLQELARGPERRVAMRQLSLAESLRSRRGDRHVDALQAMPVRVDLIEGLRAHLAKRR